MISLDFFPRFIAALRERYGWNEHRAAQVAAAIGDRPMIIDGEIVAMVDGEQVTVDPELYDSI